MDVPGGIPSPPAIGGGGGSGGVGVGGLGVGGPGPGPQKKRQKKIFDFFRNQFKNFSQRLESFSYQ